MRREQGFTLLEILAAFVIFALVFATTLRALSGSLRNTQRAADYSQAALWAQTALDRLGIEPPLEEGTYSGEFDESYRWEMEIALYEIEAQEESAAPQPSGLDFIDVPVDLYAVELQVLWGDADRPRGARFRTLRSATPQPR